MILYGTYGLGKTYHAKDYGPASGGPQTTLTWITKFELYVQPLHAHLAGL